MRLLWFLACQRAIIDRETRKISLIDVSEALNIQEEIPVGEKAGLLLGLQLAAAFWFGDGDDEPIAEVRLRLRAPDGKTRDLKTLELGESGKVINSSARLLIRVESIEYKGEGVYHFELDMRSKGKLRWKQVSSYPLIVRTRPSPAASLGPFSEGRPSAPPESS